MFGLMRSHGARPERWRLHYCGTCKTMGREYGQRSRLLLNHDAVFLAELLTSLSGEQPEAWGGAYVPWKCARLPSKDEMPAILRYIAAATILLTEYKVDDHAADSGRMHWAWARRLFSARFRKARRELAAFGFPLAACDRILSRQASIEAAGATCDEAAAPTAEATALVFRHGARVAGLAGREDEFAHLGHGFGRLTYLVDAWEDYDADGRSGAFNPLRLHGLSRQWAAAQIRREAADLAALLPPAFAARLKVSIDAKLGVRFAIVQGCQPRKVRSPLPWAAALTLLILIPAQAGPLGSAGKWVGIGVLVLVAVVVLIAIQSKTGCDCCAICTCLECCDCCSSCG